MRWFLLVSVVLLGLAGREAPPAPQHATYALASTHSPMPSVELRPSPAEVIAKAGSRPDFGAASDGRVLLVWSAAYGSPEETVFWTAYRVMNGDRVVSERLVTRTPAVDYFATVEPVPAGFLVVGYGKDPRFVSSAGGSHRIRVKQGAVDLKVGDVPVGIDGLLYRPSTTTVHVAVRAPGATVASHVDGAGTWWSLGEIEDGQQVMWSRTPHSPWVKHLVGAQEPYLPQCTCPWQPSIEGRGPVVVASMGPLNHVSLDYGATWSTYDLGDSKPYKAIYKGLREPHTSSLSDGRIVTGYMRYWVADDASNSSFRSTTYRGLTMWSSGLSSAPIRRRNAVSVDGGQTWVTLDP